MSWAGTAFQEERRHLCRVASSDTLDCSPDLLAASFSPFRPGIRCHLLRGTFLNSSSSVDLFSPTAPHDPPLKRRVSLSSRHFIIIPNYLCIYRQAGHTRKYIPEELLLPTTVRPHCILTAWDPASASCIAGGGAELRGS